MRGDHKSEEAESENGGTESGPLRIQAVAERTGVPEPTLRAWELRYGIPSPRRTASGYRLYSERDIEQVRRMQRLCAGGMAAAEAARTVKSATAKKQRATSNTPVDPMQASRAAILDAVEAFDPNALDVELQRLLFLDGPIEVLDGVLVPLLHEVGNRWHSGKFSIAQEHMVSHRIGTLLRDYLRWMPTRRDAPVALLGSFADDEHDLGLLATAVRLGSWGFECIFLGARTPPGALRAAVSALAPAVVGLSITVPPERSRARELLDEYAAAVRPVPWMIGGSGVSALADLVQAAGGHVVGRDPDALHSFVHGLERSGTKRARGRRPLHDKR